MINLIRLTDYTKEEIHEIFSIADALTEGKYKNYLQGKSIIMFFPDSSVRTRVTFEQGVYLLGGQSIVFPTETLDKKEELEDVIGYLNNWADMIVVRHKNIAKLDSLVQHTKVPIINAMTDVNHPCEILSDMYALSKIRNDFTKDQFLFCGKKGNVGLAWKAASEVMGFALSQCCGQGYEIEGLQAFSSIQEAIVGKDIVCTDSLSADDLDAFRECQVTLDVMRSANHNAVLNPCPPFFRGEEVSNDVIQSPYFVGYEFKKHLLIVQQAIMIYCLEH